MSHITQLSVENVKRLRAIKITPKGDMVVIGGKNGSGKSSTLDSIAYALSGGKSLPDKPIREGEKKASVTIDLSDGLRIRRTFTESGGSLIVEQADGTKVASPQTLLDRLTGKYTFDPVRFISIDKKSQLEELRKIVNLDFSALDTERKSIFDQRTDLKKEVEKLRAKIQLAAHHKDVTDEKERSAGDILKELAAAQEKNLGKKALQDRLAAAEREVNREETNLAGIDSEIKMLEERLGVLRESRKNAGEKSVAARSAAKTLQESVAAFAETPVEEIQKRLADVEDYNRKVRENLSWNAIVKEGREKSAKVDTITSRIEAIDNEKKEMLTSAKFPVAGLSFDENGVLLNGLPFNQASSAQQLRVSVAIAAAANPELRVMLVREGSLLDEDALAELDKLAGEFNLQIWLERVSQGAECQVIISEGWVKGQEGSDEPAPKAKKSVDKGEDEDLPF